jgi:hypothetical protein
VDHQIPSAIPAEDVRQEDAQVRIMEAPKSSKLRRHHHAALPTSPIVRVREVGPFAASSTSIPDRTVTLPQLKTLFPSTVCSVNHDSFARPPFPLSYSENRTRDQGHCNDWRLETWALKSQNAIS